MDELDDRARQFGSDPNCASEDYNRDFVGLAVVFGPIRAITDNDNDGTNDSFLLAHTSHQ